MPNHMITRKKITLLCTTMFAMVPFQPSYATTLKEALEATYRNNPVLRSEQARQKATDESASQAFSGWLPSASYLRTHGDEKTSIANRATTSNNINNSDISISQPLFNGGKTIASMKRANSAVSSGQATLVDKEQQILLNAITAYMDVVRDAEVLKISKNNVEVLQKHLEATKERFDLGEVTRTDVAQAEARLSRAISERIQANGALEVSRANYKHVVGEEPANLDFPDALPKAPDTLDSVIQNALDSNPLVQQNAYNVKVAKYDVKVATGDLLPKVTFDIASRRDDGSANFGGSSYDSDTYLINFRVPLYQSGAEYSRVRQAKYMEKSKEYILQETHHAITEDAIRAWEAYNVSEATIKSTEDNVRASEIALDGVQQEADVGSRTTLDVLDAEQELFTARTNVIRARHDKNVAIYRLQSVIGKLQAKNLGLDVPVYDAEKHYQATRFKPIGLSAE